MVGTRPLTIKYIKVGGKYWRWRLNFIKQIKYDFNKPIDQSAFDPKLFIAQLLSKEKQKNEEEQKEREIKASVRTTPPFISRKCFIYWLSNYLVC